MAGRVLARKPRIESEVQPALLFFVDSEGLVRHGTPANAPRAPLYVPTSPRSSVLMAFHGLPLLGHRGFLATWEMLGIRFYWKGIAWD